MTVGPDQRTQKAKREGARRHRRRRQLRLGPRQASALPRREVRRVLPGLMHVDLGGHISDIEFTAAFDVDADKVGRDLAGVFRGQNNTVKFAEVPKLNVPVHRGMTHDGIGKYLSRVIEKAPGETADVVRILQETGTDVVVSYLPVGSEEATKWYVEQVLSAGCAFVNCVPVFIAREPYWRRRFEEGTSSSATTSSRRSARRSSTAS